MGDTGLRQTPAEVWDLVARQHGVIARRQLLALGFSSKAIAHRIAAGRLHSVWRGVYAVGRPGLTQHGRWMAAVLACGPDAVLSHVTAGALWGIRAARRDDQLHVSVPAHVARRVRGIGVYRRSSPPATRHLGIPVTDPVCTLLDLGSLLSADQLETAINEGDKLGLIDPDELRSAVGAARHRRGAPALRSVLDRHTFTLTDSELERRFLPLARAAGLPLPDTGRYRNGFKVDFLWPSLGLVVETDGLRYHRTPAEQARDRLRDQAHAAAGLTPLRFTHAQVAFEPRHVEATLAAVARRLSQGA